MVQEVSFVHCADIHLDASFKGDGSHSFSSERRKDLKKTFEAIINIVLEKDADFLLISGDLYEHDYASKSTINWLNEQFSKLGDKPVVIVTGNHDPYVKNAWYRIYPWRENVRILTTASPEFMDNTRNVYFYGIGFDTFRQERLPDIKPPSISTEKINICLFHGTLDMDFTGNPYNPVSSEELHRLGFDYYALGHFHRKNESLAEAGMIYPGSPEPLGFDEQGEHGVYFVSISKENGKAETRYHFIQIQQRKYVEYNLDAGGIQSEEELIKRAELLLSSSNAERDIVKINLSGRIPADISLDLAALEHALADRCFSLDINDCTYPDYDLDELAKEKNITGVFINMMKEKIDNASGDEKQMLEKALYLGLEALLTGKVDIS
ncbi:MAG: DNA repair exonuclease [Clostridiaceae bacterium]|jgi:DNA repair exonuclease SbcCD nuclease subunit|nr:DNA repair exonuclease [Clostridiaceae bacterium]